MANKNYPSEIYRGEECIYWNLGGSGTNCCYPKTELFGKEDCGGRIGNFCLPIITGVPNPSHSADQLTSSSETIPPEPKQISPGDIV